MTMPEPFAYPSTPHDRKHGPGGYKNYQEYKPWLRDEFAFRCLYCLEREQWYPDRSASFSADHIIPQVLDRSIVCSYGKLVYACTRCNSAKQDVMILDPTAIAIGHHLKMAADGSIKALTAEGQDVIDLLHLDKAPALVVRRHYLRILALKLQRPEDPEIDRLYAEAFGYPDDLPDLTKLRPPGGNARAGSEATSFHARRTRGELPTTY